MLKLLIFYDCYEETVGNMDTLAPRMGSQSGAGWAFQLGSTKCRTLSYNEDVTFDEITKRIAYKRVWFVVIRLNNEKSILLDK